jgi:hypothetical protein
LTQFDSHQQAYRHLSKTLHVDACVADQGILAGTFCLAAFSKWLLLTLPKSFTVTVPNSANLSASPFLVRHGIGTRHTAIFCTPSTTTPPHSAFPLTVISIPQLQIYHLRRSAATTEARRLERGAGWLVLQIQIPRRARRTRKEAMALLRCCFPTTVLNSQSETLMDLESPWCVIPILARPLVELCPSPRRKIPPIQEV